MSRSKLVLSALIILIIAGGGLLGFYFYINKTSPLEQAPLAPNKPTFKGFDQMNLETKQPPKIDLGSYDENATTTATTPEATSTVDIVEKEPLLRLISPQPVAGADFVIHDVDISTSSAVLSTSTLTAASTTKKLAAKVPKKIISSELIRFVLRANGNIFETSSSTPIITRITNVTFPKLQEAYFNIKGDGVIIRNIIGDDGIQTRYLSLKPDTANSTSTLFLITSTNFPNNITQMAVTLDKSKIFYVTNSSPRGTITSFAGLGKISAFDSPFREWLPQWLGPNTMLLNTKPSATTPGYLYSLDTKTSNIKKVIGNITGLTTLASNDGKNLLYADTESSNIQLSLLNLKDRSERFLFAQTLPEKCVWGNKNAEVVYCAVPKEVSNLNSYPDDWYLGLVHFDDNIWKLNLKTGENKFLANPMQQLGIPLDIVNMKLSKNDNYLIFTDKNTLSLWGLEIRTSTTTLAGGTR